MRRVTWLSALEVKRVVENAIDYIGNGEQLLEGDPLGCAVDLP